MINKDKIKFEVNKKYATISVYVIITAAIIFALARAAFEAENIVRTLALGLHYIFKLLTPVFVGCIIAYVINPMVGFIERMLKKIKLLKFKNKKKYRVIAVLSSVIIITIGIFLLVGTFIFSITKQFSNINVDKIISVITGYINSFSDSLKDIEKGLNTLNIESKGIEQYITQFSNALANWLKNFANNIVANTMNISGYISNFVLGLIISIYLLIDKDDFIGYGKKFLKAMFSDKTEKKIKGYIKDLNYIFSGYIRGTMLDALFMCVALSLTLSIVGIKFGVLIGILAGLCNLIPYFGPIVAFSGTIIFGMLNGQYSQVIIAIIILIILQQIDGNIIGPKLVGSSVSLKPIFILIALIIGASIGGVIGMVLAVPVAATIKLFLKRAIEGRLKKKELLKDEKN